MRKVFKVGGFGCLGLMILVVACSVMVANRPQPQQQVSGQAVTSSDGKPQLAKVGQTTTLKGWELTLSDFGPYERFAPDKPPVTQAQGRLLVADMRIKNLQDSTSNFTTNDFKLKAPDTREFAPTGQTAVIARGFLISQAVQPGLITENRVVFDVDPAVKAFTFTGLGMQFEVQAS